ncbi:MAG: pyridoxal phosphate-dependent aminotransferase [Tissierellia bacterium]|nr:pyridoxal phosphate-dependent aminotransferase [Tissierellia bacterium]
MTKFTNEEMQEKYLAKKAKVLLHHPQGMGNYFTFHAAAEILGIDGHALAIDGAYNVNAPGYYDMGYMANLIGPPQSAIDAMIKATNKELLSVYPPDISGELREIVAKKKFHREIGEDFDVMGVEGAQGGIGYAYLTFLDPGDEIIVTDPGYFHFSPSAESIGAVIKTVELNEENQFRLKPEQVEAVITDKTKMIVVCDPINPFGTIQTKEELLEIARIARERDIIIFNNITHNTHHVDETVEQIPMASLHSEEHPMDHVISTSGTSKGYGMPAARVGFLAGHPALLRGAFLIKMETTKIHINYQGQMGAIAAMKDKEYLEKSTEIIKRNLKHIQETVAMVEGVKIPILPKYGFSMIIDVSETGATAQEITVGLLKRKVVVTPGDGLGERGATEYIRLNYSFPDIVAFEALRKALPEAIAEAKEGVYREGVIKFYEKVGSTRGKEIIEKLKSMN